MVAALAVFAAGLAGSGAFALRPDEYAIYPLGSVWLDVAALRVAAQANGFAVVDLPGEAQTGSEQMALAAPADRLLVTSGNRFYLRVAHSGLAYAMRPSELGAELVLIPGATIDEMDALGSVLLELQELGISGMDVDLGARQTFARNALKGPATPAGVALDSTLYGLIVSEDWFAYAAAKSLTLRGLDVEVVAEKIPGAALPEAFAAYVTAETDELARLVLPVEQLLALARSSSVGYVRPPYVPAIP